MTVALLSDDPAFLDHFAEVSLTGRLQIWSMRLLVFTRLDISQLNPIIEAHYTFSFMNTTFIAPIATSANVEYVKLSVVFNPFSYNGCLSFPAFRIF